MTGTTSVADWGGVAFPNNWYKFSLTSLSNVQLSLAGITSTAQIFLFDANGLEIGNALTTASDLQSLLANLAAGTYYFEVSTQQDTAFSLTASATAVTDVTGHTFSTATSLAAPTATASTVDDWVGGAQPADFYKFTLTAAAVVNLRLSALHTQGVENLILFDASGARIDANVANAFQNGTLTDSLGAGTYYVEVSGASDSTYALTSWTGAATVGASGQADNAGNSISSANSSALGALSSTVKTVAGYVGPSDADDFYRFTLSAAGHVDFELLGLTDSANLALFDGAGNPVQNLGSAESTASLGFDLGAGTYYLDVQSTGGTGTGYNLAANVTALPNAAGTTQAAATSLGALTSTPTTHTDWVGPVTATQDWYAFTLSSLSNVSLNVSGLRDYNYLTIDLTDQNGNILSEIAPAGAQPETLLADLAAGTYFVKVVDNYNTGATYTLTASATALPNAVGATQGAATSLGALSATTVSKSDWIGAAAPDDFYSFSVGALSTVGFRLTGINNANANLEILDGSSNVLATTFAPSSGGIEGIVADLAAGTYYLRVNDTADTPYTVSGAATALPNAAGATLAAATSLGALSSTPVVKSDWAGAAAPDDYYKFTLTSAATVTEKLIGNASLTLLNSSNEAIDYSFASIDSLVDSLAAGTYYIHVASNGDAPYTLTVNTGLPAVGSSGTDGAGNTLAAAKSVGALTTTAKTFADYIGGGDPEDAYSFTLGALSNVNLSLAGLSDGATLTLTDASGVTVQSVTGVAQSNGLISANLAAGTYFVEVTSAGAGTGYSFSASATALPAASGATLATATSLGSLGTTAVTKSDWVGSASPNDFYQFSVGTLSTVTLGFTGMSNDNETLTLYDNLNNQIGTASSSASNVPGALTQTLAAGTYYLRVNDASDTAYTLTAVSTSAASAAPVTLAARGVSTATSLGNLPAAGASTTGTLDYAAADAWYKFTLTGLKDVRLTLGALSASATLSLLDANGAVLSGTSYAGVGQPGVLDEILGAGTYFVHLNSAGPTSYTLTSASTVIGTTTGHTLATATSIAAPTSTTSNLNDYISSQQPDNWYAFKLTAQTYVNLELLGLNDGVAFNLLDGNGQVIAPSVGDGPLGTALISTSLAAGSYYIQVDDGFNATSYTLSTWAGAPALGTSSQPDTAGNTIAAANTTALGALGTTPRSVAGWVGAADTDDYYRFSVSAQSTVSFQIVQQSPYIYANLYDASGDSITAISGAGDPTFIALLGAGVYYIDVQNGGGDTGYNLSATATATPNGVGRTLASATGLGALTATTQSFSDFVGGATTDDYYAFTLGALSSVSLTLSGADVNGDQVSILDADGRVVSNFYYPYLAANQLPALVQGLAAGSYFIEVHGSNGAYTLSTSATALPDAIGSTLGAATSLGSLSTTTVTRKDWAGAAKPDDYYSFTLGSLSTVTFRLKGTTDNGGALAILDASGGVLYSSSATSDLTLPNSLIATLAAGTYYLHVQDSQGSAYALTASSSNAASAAPSIPTGRSLATAASLGALTTTATTASNFVGAAAPAYDYAFTVGALSNVQLALTGLSQAATVTLVNANGAQIGATTSFPGQSDLLLNDLAAGTYYAEVSSNSDTPFTLTASATLLPDAGGRTLAAADTIATPTATVASLDDWFGAAAPDDYYKFTLTSAQTVNLRLSNFKSGGGGGLSLLDADGNTIDGSGSASASFNADLTDTLQAGTYYVKASDATDANYTLSWWTGTPTVGNSSQPDNAGSDVGSANTTAFGALTAGSTKTVAGYVDGSDADDVFQFTVNALSTVDFEAAGITGQVTLNVLQPDGSVIISHSSSPGEAASVLADLQAGTYYIDVANLSGANGYSLSATTTALPDAVGATQATATSLGALSSTPIVKSDWLKFAKADDWYSFTLSSLSRVSMNLSGEHDYNAAQAILTDASGNAIANVPEYGVASITQYADLAAGTYYIHVTSLNNASGPYTLTTSAALLPNAAGNSFGAAASLGALSTTPTSVSDWVGTAAPSDYYAFTLGALSTVSFKLSGANNSGGSLYIYDSSTNQLAYAGGVAATVGQALNANLAAGSYYVEYSDAADTAYTLTGSAVALPNTGGASLAAAANLGALGSTTIARNDWIGAAAPTDYYKFTLASAQTVTAKLAANNNPGGTVYLLNASGGAINNSSGGLGGATAAVASLAAGTYYVEVADNNDSAYQLSLSTGLPTVGTAASDGAGNTLAAAKAIGALTTTAQTFADWVGAADPTDVYQFSLTAPSKLSLNLSGLAANATDLLSIVDAYGDTLGQTYVSSSNNGLVSLSLGAGTYVARIDAQGADSGYSFSASATAQPNAIGTTLATASNLGSLGTTAVSRTDWAGAAAQYDYYQFTLGALANVTITFTGVASDLETLTVFNNAGQQVASATSANALTPGVLTAKLGAGVYYVEVNNAYDTTYTLSAVSDTAASNLSAVPAGRGLSTAVALGALGATAVTRSDFVGAAAPNEWVSFTIGATSQASLTLSGASDSVEMTLLDANGNQIGSAGASPTDPSTLTTTLAAGTYFAKVSVNGAADTQFTLSATASPLTSTAGHTLASATAIAAPSSTAASYNDGLSGVAADYYAFTLAASTYVNLQVSGMASGGALELLDANGQLLGSSASFSFGGGDLNEQLAAGSYFLQVTGSAAYTLTTSSGAPVVGTSSQADNAGNTLAAANATAFATLTSTPKSVVGYVSASDTDDFFKFTVNGPSTVNLQAVGLTQYANFNVYNAAGVLLYGTESLNPSYSANLAGGVYYVDVQSTGAGVGYQLQANALALPNATGVAMATATSLGALTAAGTTKSDWVGAAAPTDWYSFSVNSLANVTLNLNGAVVNDSYSLILTDASGNVINQTPGANGPFLYNALKAGTYYVELQDPSGVGGAYSLKATAAAATPLGGATLATARVLAVNNTSIQDFVSQANPINYYSFTATAQRQYGFEIDGLTSQATLSLYDASLNLIKSATGGANQFATIVEDLKPAQYILEVSDGSAATDPYRLLATTTPIVTVALLHDTGSSATDLLTNDPTLTGTGNINTTVSFAIDGVASHTTVTSSATGAWSFLPTGLADGVHTVVVSETNSVGYTSSATITFTLDTTSPVVTAALASDTGASSSDGITNNDGLKGAADANATVSISVDGGAAVLTTANASGVWTYAPTGLADGTHTAVVSETDAAGNVGSSSVTFTLDTAAPTVTLALASDTGASASDRITSQDGVTGTGIAGATVHLNIDGAANAATTTADSNGNWSYTPTGLADGSHTIVASETDVAGNVGTGTLTFTLDTHAPAITGALVSDTGSSSTDKLTKNPAVGGVTEAGDTVSFVIDGQAAAQTVVANGSGAWSFAPTGLADGAHTIVATAADLAGNSGSVSLGFTLDTTAPATTIQLADDTGTSSTDNYTYDPSLKGLGDPNATVSFTVDGSAISSTATANSMGAWSFLPSGLTLGQHTVVASETDAAGNIGAASLTFTLYAAAPQLSANDTTVAMGASVAASSLINVSAPPGHAVQNFEFLDSSTASSSGFFLLNGAATNAGSILDVAPANLNQLAFVGGSATGTDELWARATDGATYGDWINIEVTTQGNSTQPATVATHNASMTAGTSVAMSSLFTVSDPASLSMKEYQFLDMTPAANSGFLSVGGTAQPANHLIDVAASALSGVTFTAGASGQSDILEVRAYDGGSWSPWASLTASAV